MDDYADQLNSNRLYDNSFDYNQELYYVPPEFQDCPKEYRPETDYQYLTCVVPSDEDRCELLKELHLVKDFRTYFLAVIPLILSIITSLLNIAFVILAIYVLDRRKVGRSSKKLYAFLLSRSISTIIVQLLFYVVLIVWKTGGFHYSSATIFLLVASLSYLTMTGTYLAMTSLLYMAVSRPLWYRTNVTLVKCSLVIMMIWVISIGFSVCVGLFGATLFYHNTSPIACSFQDCQKPLALAIVIILSICYISVIALYISMFTRIRWRHRRRRSMENIHIEVVRKASEMRNEKALYKLSLNIGTFVVSKMPILVVSIVALANLEHLSSLGDDKKSPCKTYLHGSLYFQVELLASIAAIIWLIGMIADPIVNAICDPHMLKMLIHLKNRVGNFFAQLCHKGRSAVNTCEPNYATEEESSE
uniref:G-protein coupled receptors family 1 profile domain-containing protein n=1 Tax=Acrobeloides nanus TaxID=290746 RepID=A0A914C5H8_9BILA